MLVTVMFPRSLAMWNPMKPRPPTSAINTTALLTQADDFFILRSRSDAPGGAATVVAISAMESSSSEMEERSGEQGKAIARLSNGYTNYRSEERRVGKE